MGKFERVIPVLAYEDTRVMSAQETGLPQESVANVSQVSTLDKSVFSKQIGKIPASKLELVFAGIDVVLGR